MKAHKTIAVLILFAMLMPLVSCGAEPVAPTEQPTSAPAPTAETEPIAEPAAPTAEPVAETPPTDVPPEPAQPGEPRYGGTAILVSATKPLILDPGWTDSGDDARLAYHLYDTLVQFDHGTADIAPGLAESWDTSEDGTVWTFHLREGVKFHDGTDFNAEAVVFTYMRFLDENHPYYQVGGTWSYFDYLLGEQVVEIKAVDELTVEFVLKGPFAPFLVCLAYYPSSIVSPTALEKWGEDFPRHPVGTGPFMLEEWVADQYVSLVANENYWAGRPYLDGIVVREIPEMSTGLLELLGGNVHVLVALTPDQVPTVTGQEGLDVMQIPGANLSWALLNQEFEPLQDVRVRQALNYAVNVEEIVQELWAGTALRAVNPYPPTMPCWNDEIEPYPYDPDRARELLAEAGYADGFDMEITYSRPRPYLPYPEAIAQAIVADLQAVGVNAVAREMEWGEFTDESGVRALMAPMSGWYDIPEMDLFMNAMILAGGYSRGDNYPPEMFELAEQAVRTYDMDERCAAYRQMQQIFHDHADRIPLAHSSYQTGVSDKLHGMIMGVDGQERLMWAWLEE